MQTIKQPQFKLIGIKFDGKIRNENDESGIACGSLWRKFEAEGIFAKIPNKLTNEAIAVYYEYDGDHTQPYSFFIGCKVSPDTQTPEGLKSITIPEQNYEKVVAKGKMPDCVGEAWMKIWKSDINRAYTYDFEVYGEKCYDWNNVEVDIFLAVK